MQLFIIPVECSFLSFDIGDVWNITAEKLLKSPNMKVSRGDASLMIGFIQPANYILHEHFVAPRRDACQCDSRTEPDRWNRVISLDCPNRYALHCRAVFHPRVAIFINFFSSLNILCFIAWFIFSIDKKFACYASPFLRMLVHMIRFLTFSPRCCAIRNIVP